MSNQELCHYGVKGMQWGVRKNKYITVRQGFKNARDAGKDAWQKSVSDNGGKLVGKNKQIAVYKNPIAMRRGRKAARTAYNDAMKESMKSDKAYNKQLRTKAVDKLKKVLNKKVSDLKTENSQRRKEELERHLFPWKDEQEKLNRLGRVPTREQQLEKHDRNNI